MRKLLLALVCLFSMAGLVVAAEVTMMKFDKETKKMTVKEGDDEKVYKVTDKTKFSSKDKDGNVKESTYEQVEKLLSNEKLAGKLKFDITVKDGEITEATFKRGKKK